MEVERRIPSINAKRGLVIRRVDDLYRFIHAWVPSLYGELDENYWRERGYILLDTDTDLSPELSGAHEAGKAGESTEEGKSRQDSDEISELTRESWEVSVIIIYLFIFFYIFEIVSLFPSEFQAIIKKFSSFYVGTLNSHDCHLSKNFILMNDFHDWESRMLSRALVMRFFLSFDRWILSEKKKVVVDNGKK